VRVTLADLLADAEAAGPAADLRRAMPEPAARRRRRRRLSARLRRQGRSAGRSGVRRDDRAPVAASHAAAGRLGRDYLAERCADDRFDCDLMRAIAEANRQWGASTGAKMWETSSGGSQCPPPERAARCRTWSLIVFTGGGRAAQSHGRTAKADADYDRHAGCLLLPCRSCWSASAVAALAADHGRGPACGPGVRAGLHGRQAERRCRRLQRPDRVDPAAARTPGWATGCATSSTGRSTMC
jgi:ATP-dependent helicase/nuclease subunit A